MKPQFQKKNRKQKSMNNDERRDEGLGLVVSDAGEGHETAVLEPAHVARSARFHAQRREVDENVPETKDAMVV